MQEKRCSKCNNWSPHVYYTFVGYCCIKGDISHSEYLCESFTELRFEEEFLWCESCRIFISREELEDHLVCNHRVFKGVFMDRDYREELYEG